jgi:hypothetical protein
MESLKARSTLGWVMMEPGGKGKVKKAQHMGLAGFAGRGACFNQDGLFPTDAQRQKTLPPFFPAPGRPRYTEVHSRGTPHVRIAPGVRWRRFVLALEWCNGWELGRQMMGGVRQGKAHTPTIDCKPWPLERAMADGGWRKGAKTAAGYFVPNNRTEHAG